MLSIRVENLSDLAIIECKGRIVRSDSVFKLRDVVREQAAARVSIFLQWKRSAVGAWEWWPFSIAGHATTIFS